MKYSEFKAEVEKMGYTYNEASDGIYVQNSVGTIVVVGRYNTHAISTTWGAFGLLTEFEKGQFFNLCHKLAKTPLAEREEEKRYWLRKIPVPLLDKEGEKKWLWKYTGTAPSNMFGVDTTKIDSELYKTIFTESEIAEMDITGFKKEPVE